MAPGSASLRSTQPFSSPWLALAGLAVAAILAYANSLNAPFIFDDIGAITNNRTIESFATALHPPPAANGAVGRPLVNLSLAFNFALGGRTVRGYHVLNLGLHVLSGWLLFGLVRRTLASSTPAAAVPAAFAIALLWLVHPLQTEAVTCIVQRSELLAGVFCFLTLYAVLRGVEASDAAPARAASAARRRAWFTVAVASCLLGVTAKEVIVGVPLLVLLYDRTFLAGNFRAALGRRRRLYAGLAASWIVLGWLVQHAARRAGVAGFGLGVGWWDYLLTQCDAIVLYLRLAGWPYPLVLDYGMALVPGAAAVWPQALLLLALAGATGWALWRKPRAGFVGAWFFILLAPSSSVVPLVTQTMAEHRMYLPLAAPIVLAVLGLRHAAGARGAAWVCAPLAAIMIALTSARNHDYRSAVAIWSDTVARRPDNPRARQNLGVALAAEGRATEAISQYEAALILRPADADAHLNLANTLQELGRHDEAAIHYAAALRANPDLPDADYNLANIAAAAGRYEEAIVHYTEALRRQPDYANAQHNLGNVLLLLHRPAEAVGHFAAALQLEPGAVSTRANLGVALALAGHRAEAEQQLEQVLRLDPENATAHTALARLRADGAGP